MHNVGMIRVGSTGVSSSKTKEKLEQIWKEKQFLIIGKDLMIEKVFLTKFAEQIDIVKVDNNVSKAAFGGLGVLVCGGFHQLPPVACHKTAPCQESPPWAGLSMHEVERQALGKVHEGCVS